MASFVQNLKQKIKNNAVCRFFEYNKNFIITIVVPLALCPLPILIPTKVTISVDVEVLYCLCFQFTAGLLRLHSRSYGHLLDDRVSTGLISYLRLIQN